MRKSIASQRNLQLGNWSNWVTQNNVSNVQFFEEALKVMQNDFHVGNGGVMAIGLVGSRDIPGITLRRAQAVLRWDRRPSFWSHAFLITKPRSRIKNTPILEVPLHARSSDFPNPGENGLNRNARLNTYNNPDVDVNVALITVAKRVEQDGSIVHEDLDAADVKAVRESSEDPNRDRLRYDLWECLCAWQQYLWSDGSGENPLRQGVPVPSSAYVEMAYEAMGLDLVPGASERNSAPEHIWNAAQWWHQESAKEHEEGGQDVPFVMVGCYAVRDAGASMID